MNLKRLPNVTMITTPVYKLLYSYDTLVAYQDLKSNQVYKTAKKWSSTTSRHISTWLKEEINYPADQVLPLDQRDLDKLSTAI